MSRFEHTETGVVFSVDDSKDERYMSGPYKAATEEKSAAKKAPARSSSDK